MDRLVRSQSECRPSCTVSKISNGTLDGAGGSDGRGSTCQRRRPEFDLEAPLKKGMATHSIIFAWRIPWTEEPGGLQSMGSQRVGQD